MGVLPRLFISHSSKDADAQAALGDLVAALRSGPDPLDVLYDQEVIEAGDAWRERIYWMLHACDAALILLTPSSLRSPWVRAEATCLRWIRGDRAEFPVLPVLWDDRSGSLVTRAELKQNPGWSPIGLPDDQFVSGCGPDAVAAAVRSRLAGLRTRPSLMDVLIGDITHELRGLPEERLARALDDVADVTIDRHSRYPVPATIARWFLGQPPPALMRLAGVFAALGPSMAAGDAERLLAHLRPLWVEMEAAGWIRRVRQPDPPVRHLALSCARPGAVDQYLDRAFLTDARPVVLHLHALADGAGVETTLDEIRWVARQQFPTWRNVDEALLEQLLRKVRPHVVLRLPDDPSLPGELQRRLPDATFLYYDTDDEDAAVLPSGVGWIEPRHDHDLERDAELDWLAATALVGAGAARPWAGEGTP